MNKKQELSSSAVNTSELTPVTGKALRSSDLFGKERLVLIQHNTDIYRLMITKQAKLILTK